MCGCKRVSCRAQKPQYTVSVCFIYVLYFCMKAVSCCQLEIKADYYITNELLILINCCLLVSAVVVSLYEDPIQPQQAASVVEKLGDYLITCGY